GARELAGRFAAGEPAPDDRHAVGHCPSGCSRGGRFAAAGFPERTRDFAFTVFAVIGPGFAPGLARGLAARLRAGPAFPSPCPSVPGAGSAPAALRDFTAAGRALAAAFLPGGG